MIVTTTTSYTESAHIALVDDTKSSWASTPTQPAYGTEVVVNVHAGRTTTSEAEARFGVITDSKQKLTTRENSDRYKQSTSVCSTTTVQTTATMVWMDVVVLEHSYDDVHTAFRRLATIEEGIRGKAPSSSEISFPHN